MTDVPYKRFVVVHDQLHLAVNGESHLQLAYVASASLPAEERLSALNERIEGWLIGKGKNRRAVIRSTEAPDAVARVQKALRKARMSNVQVVYESDADVRFPGSESHFGQTIRRLIGLHGVTASAAAAQLGLTPQALSQIQSGARRPSIDTLRRVSTFFDIAMERLLDAPFDDLLVHELTDVRRFHRVEAKLVAGSEES